MAYLNEDQIYDAKIESDKEADIWRADYPEYERLADNGLLDDLDENLPEVNDGSLAASLFKLAKRVIRKNLGGRAKVVDRDENWMTELGNIEFDYIMAHARSKASPRRKGKDAVRKAAIFGGQPIVNLQVERGSYRGQDFIVPYAQDVKLEAGKDSDEDSDIIFWDVYFSRLQVENMLEQAKQEIEDGIATADAGDTEASGSDSETQANKKAKAELSSASAKKNPATEDKADNGDDEDEEESYNTWNIDLLQEILDANAKVERPGNEQPKSQQDKGVKKAGIHFYIAWQRGVNAPFKLMHKRKAVQAWSNPDPTGDVPCHYLYCYQDFVNPYGIGIVKLAGGTQNVLDYMRQADILATQLGLRPPKQIMGDEDQVDEDSLVYAQDANWYVGQAKVERMELASGVYNQLPNRMSMYKTSLNQLIPTGDTSIGTSAGDPQTSKTPAGVNFQAQNLSIDDEDFAENFDECWAAVARSMINNQFANMQGSDWRRLTDDQKKDLLTAGAPKELFELDQEGNPTNSAEIVWDDARATFDFEVDSTTGFELNAQDEINLIKETLTTLTPQTSYYLGQAGWKVDIGEVYYSLLSKMNLDNMQKILSKMTDEEKQNASQQPFPIIDPPQIRLTGQVPTAAMPYALQQGGVYIPPGTALVDEQVDMGDILKDPNTTAGEKAQIKAQAGIQPDPAGLQQPSQAQLQAGAASGSEDTKGQITPETALKAQQQEHQQQIDVERLNLDKSKLVLEAHKATAPESVKPVNPGDFKAQQNSERSTQNAKMPDFTPEEAASHIAQVQEIYGVDPHTAAAALEAERQGYNPHEIIATLKGAAK